MAQLLKCKLCGFKTVRCGMTNHLKAKHREEFVESHYDVDELATFLGNISTKEFRKRKVIRVELTKL